MTHNPFESPPDDRSAWLCREEFFEPLFRMFVWFPFMVPFVLPIFVILILQAQLRFNFHNWDYTGEEFISLGHEIREVHIRDHRNYGGKLIRFLSSGGTEEITQQELIRQELISSWIFILFFGIGLVYWCLIYQGVAHVVF